MACAPMKPKGYKPGRANSARKQGSEPNQPRMAGQEASFYTLANVKAKAKKLR